MRILIDVDGKSGVASVLSVTHSQKSSAKMAPENDCETPIPQPSGAADYVALGAWIPLGFLMALWLSLGVLSGSLFSHFDNSQVRVLAILSFAGVAITLYLLGRRRFFERQPLRAWQASGLTFLSVVTFFLFLFASAG